MFYLAVCVLWILKRNFELKLEILEKKNEFLKKNMLGGHDFIGHIFPMLKGEEKMFL